MRNEVMYKDLIAFHPGLYIEDVVDELNITRAEFADRLGIVPETLSKIIDGEDDINTDIANRLAKLTGISSITWMNLQANHDKRMREIQSKK
jgi:addiction module antidote protein, HigA family